MNPTSRFMEVDGVSHHYLDWHNDDKPPLLMLHGTGHCASVWNYLAEELCSDFHVMALDQRGHGDSGSPGQGYTFLQLTRDLTGVIRSMGKSHVNVMGHSSGGLAALLADSLEPGLISRGVLVEVVIKREEVDPHLSLPQVAERTRKKRSVWESRDAMLAALKERPAYQSWQEQVLRDFVQGSTRLQPDGRAELKCNPETEALYYEDREALDMLPYLSSVKGQYLLLLGNYSGPQAQTRHSEGVRYFLETVDGSQVMELGVGTHFLPMEHADLVLREARNFLLK